ncbi:hypothetical protein [Streptomyces sp. YIM 98790]|uniref:hypothetical protein n=1 Tax=Streptomyces sp. YIM 98790 TaxID=2689077 RepID=UPI00140D32BC|nr:hypothetical protein [Streptomyces sp. YIM 98790]
MDRTEPEDAGEDELYVLTAALLTPAAFPAVLGDDFPEACEALGLEPFEDGYGLLFGQDGQGARWTVATEDVALTACAIAAWDCGMSYDLSPDERTVAGVLPGWPVPVGIAVRGLPAPHDPEPLPDEEAFTPLAPPDPESWGPAQRRMGADEIALHWFQWRRQVDPEDFAGPGAPVHEGVQEVLRQLHGYLDDPPPAGRVRSAFAGQDVRTLRADGPGWSMVAHTDDIAFVLLDDEPGEVFPVGRGPELPGLLKRLDALAVRPEPAA